MWQHITALFFANIDEISPMARRFWIFKSREKKRWHFRRTYNIGSTTQTSKADRIAYRLKECQFTLRINWHEGILLIRCMIGIRTGTDLEHNFKTSAKSLIDYRIADDQGAWNEECDLIRSPGLHDQCSVAPGVLNQVDLSTETKHRSACRFAWNQEFMKSSYLSSIGKADK